jgi:mannose-6-phosphate isomerase-like protein (cupin superfamily)
MDNSAVHIDDVPIQDFSTTEDPPVEMGYRGLTAPLDLDELRAGMWYFDSGEGMPYHAQTEQEECYYVLDGRFSAKLGRADETEIIELGPGGCYAAAPLVGHGHRWITDNGGTLLALGAPAVDDDAVNPHDLD